MNGEIKRLDSRFAVYPLGLLLFAAALWLILSLGAVDQASLSPPAIDTAAASSSLSAELFRNLRSPLAVLLLQILVIVALTRCCAKIMRQLRQPEVIGEVIGGILLGPSVLGLFWPDAAALLFPPTSLANLGLLSQIGLILFMFVIGMELDTEVLSKKARSAVIISHASIILPFLLGSLLSLALYQNYAPAGIAFTPFCLFMGIAMSITAFPVLARMLHERGLSRSPLGTVVLTCAAVDDLTAWCGLAVVAAVSQQGAIANALMTAGLCGLHIAVMLFVIRPLLSRWISGRASNAKLCGKGVVAATLGTAFFSALLTEAIGIHALFGAFLAGVVVPKNTAFREALAVRIESFSTIVLLPLFFALSGLRTQIGLLDDSDSWLVCGAIILVAISGKFLGSAAAARWSGSTWRESLAIGALMNTRGLVELVALNIGYDLGIITPTIFTMMVLMALLTTLMTGPLLSLLVPDSQKNAGPA